MSTLQIILLILAILAVLLHAPYVLIIAAIGGVYTILVLIASLIPRKS